MDKPRYIVWDSPKREYKIASRVTVVDEPSANSHCFVFKTKDGRLLCTTFPVLVEEMPRPNWVPFTTRTPSPEDAHILVRQGTRSLSGIYYPGVSRLSGVALTRRLFDLGCPYTHGGIIQMIIRGHLCPQTGSLNETKH